MNCKKSYSTITILFACATIENEYGNTPAQQAEFDWLLYNKPLEYVQFVLSGEIEHYFSYLQSLQIEGCRFVSSYRTFPQLLQNRSEESFKFPQSGQYHLPSGSGSTGEGV